LSAIIIDKEATKSLANADYGHGLDNGLWVFSKMKIPETAHWCDEAPSVPGGWAAWEPGQWRRTDAARGEPRPESSSMRKGSAPVAS